MTLTFYRVPLSTSNATDAIFAELEHSLDTKLCERVELSFKAGDTKAPSFLKINPNGLVPVLVHDGVPIWESAAITMYLGELYGMKAVRDEGIKAGTADEGNQLYPALGPQRGEAMKWIVWTNVTIADAGRRMVRSLNAGGDGAEGDGKKEKREEATMDLMRWMGVLNGALDGKKYLLGDGYCLADTHVWSFVRYMAFVKKDLLDSFGNVKGWMERIGERPALKKMLGDA